jgi:hypothetical protein
MYPYGYPLSDIKEIGLVSLENAQRVRCVLTDSMHGIRERAIEFRLLQVVQMSVCYSPLTRYSLCRINSCTVSIPLGRRNVFSKFKGMIVCIKLFLLFKSNSHYLVNGFCQDILSIADGDGMFIWYAIQYEEWVFRMSLNICRTDDPHMLSHTIYLTWVFGRSQQIVRQHNARATRDAISRISNKNNA